VKNFNFSDDNLYKIARMCEYKDKKITPSFYSKVCGTTGLIIFLIRDALEYTGIIIDKKTLPSKLYRLYTYGVEKTQSNIDYIKALREKKNASDKTSKTDTEKISNKNVVNAPAETSVILEKIEERAVVPESLPIATEKTEEKGNEAKPQTAMEPDTRKSIKVEALSERETQSQVSAEPEPRKSMKAEIVIENAVKNESEAKETIINQAGFEPKVEESKNNVESEQKCFVEDKSRPSLVASTILEEKNEFIETAQASDNNIVENSEVHEKLTEESQNQNENSTDPTAEAASEK